MESVRTNTYGPEYNWHELLTRAAFAKCFDFARWTLLQDFDNRDSFWVVATLRGIVEDIIFLSATKDMTFEDRNLLLSSLMRLDVEEGMNRQSRFFSKPEYYQIVLASPSKITPSTKKVRDQMREVWKRYGLNPGPSGKGNIASLADATELREIYDFFYHLASRLVHFSPSVLLRSGWGEQDLKKKEISPVFRHTNFSPYYSAMSTVYSLLLLSTFIERLAGVLNLQESFHSLAESIREQLKHQRLPELVTHEEMNMKPPNILLQALGFVLRENPELIAELDD